MTQTITFQDMKQKLKAAGRNTKYFNKAFYETFLQERTAAFKAVENADYNPETAYHETRHSKFYNENGGTYCYFLELVNR